MNFQLANLQATQLVKILVNEIFHHRRAAVSIFMAMNVLALMLGLFWPKSYSSFTTILIEEKKIIQPLMQGTAVATDVADRARLAREVIFGRKMMNQILEIGGWQMDNPSPTEQEKIIEDIGRRTSISNVGRDIIKIEYKDNDPKRTFEITHKFAELFISESFDAKSAESQAAFDFIDKQTQEYHEKLIKSEEQLKEFRTANLDAQPGSDANIGARLSQLQSRIEQASQELQEMEIKKTSLEKQLSGEAEIATVVSRENQYRARIGEFQSQLETLRLSYHETYPDIIRIKQQIEDLNEAIVTERKRREEAKAAGKVAIDDNIINNPSYQRLKAELSQTQVNIDMLNARVAEARRQLQVELERGKRVHGGEATLAELTRDYQVNRDIYHDLLRRRENARVSMNLDKERQGLSFKVQEPAAMPLQASGLRFLHFIVAGFVLGVLVPAGALYAMIQIDPKIRTESAISEKYRLPVLAVVPHLWSPGETQAARQEVRWLSLAVTAVLATVAAVAIMHVRAH